jgi:hypothetical protein
MLADSTKGQRAMTMLHEMGHNVDNMLALRLGAEDDFASELATGGEFLDGPGANEFRQLMKALSDSMFTGKPGRPGPGDRIRAQWGNRKFANYLLDDVEIFARAYAQWAAERIRGINPRGGSGAEGRAIVSSGRQWSETEFQPISEAFDNLFAALGWR